MDLEHRRKVNVIVLGSVHETSYRSNIFQNDLCFQTKAWILIGDCIVIGKPIVKQCCHCHSAGIRHY